MNTEIKDILKNLPIKSNSRILCIGEPNSKHIIETIKNIPHGEIIILDNKRSENNKSLQTIYFDFDNGNNLPIRDKTCDIVFVYHTLRNIIYRESVLKECIRTLAPGGLILLVELYENAHVVTVHPDTRIKHDDMLEYLDHAGFSFGEYFDTQHHEYGIIGVCPMIR